ncbi:unnamed protein product [Symbiodinium natans]|uniref:Uncharacterized protein n=1 Tax=Symbiodinium natans TaxID=878477 RepID=A0A812J5S1_9DINO|nr:unnamed protein product [Symbiodinium natans]
MANSVSGSGGIAASSLNFEQDEDRLLEEMSSVKDALVGEDEGGGVNPETPQKRPSCGAGAGQGTPISPTDSQPTPVKLCLACKSPATKGSLCDIHKRVSDNLYTEEKKQQTSNPNPARWKKFMGMRKAQNAEWVNTLIHATPAKGGNPGSGRATGSYDSMQASDILKQESSLTGQFQSKSFNARMYTKKIQEEWGWDPVEANEEWQRLLAATPEDKVIQKPTLPGRKMEPWIFAHDIDVLIGSQGLSHASQIQLNDKVKKKPKASDIAAAEGSLAASSLHFSDRFFSQMGATSSATQSLRDGGGSAIADGTGHSFMFGTSAAAAFREKAAGNSAGSQEEQKEKKAKKKAFVLEDVVDSYDFRMKKKLDATVKLMKDTVSEINEFIAKEPEGNQSKMGRVLHQVKWRLAVLRALAVEASWDQKTVPTKLTFSEDCFGLEAEERSDLLRSFVEDGWRLQFLAAVRLWEQCKDTAAIAEGAEPESDAVSEAVKGLSAYVGDIFACDFKIKGADGEVVEYMEKDLLMSVMSLHGWAGSGFADEIPALKDLQDNVAMVSTITYLKIFFLATHQQFLANAKPLAEPEVMEKMAPVQVFAARFDVNLRLQSSEDGVKGVETAFKDAMDSMKALVGNVKSTFSVLAKQSRD